MVTLLYNCVMLAADGVALWAFCRWKRGFCAWLAVMVAISVFGFALSIVVGGTLESHFGVFRLWCYSVFLHNVALLLATAYLWRKTHRYLAVGLLLLATAVLGIAADAFLIEPHWLEVSHRRITSPKVHKPVRIVVVADLQTDQIGDYEKNVFRRAMAEKPDLILLAGDYFQADWRKKPGLAAQLNEFLHEIHFAAPLGIFAVQGNVDADDWPGIFTELGVRSVMQTKTFEPGELQLTCLGLRDSFNPRLSVHPGNDERFRIVLGHAPNYVLGDVTADLMVAGHTHGGQVRLPFVGAIITHAVIPNRWAAGLTELPKGGLLFVSRGIGMEYDYAPRMRFLCRPELAVIDVAPEK